MKKVLEQELEKIAKLAHNVIKAYCESLGDNSIPEWADTSKDVKETTKLGIIGHLKNSLTPKETHELWVKNKKDNGWIYGELKDEELKTHPCIVPYEDLSQEQKSKDYIFKAICDFFKA